MRQTGRRAWKAGKKGPCVRVRIAGKIVTTEVEGKKRVLMDDVEKQRRSEASAPYRKRRSTGPRVA